MNRSRGSRYSDASFCIFLSFLRFVLVLVVVLHLTALLVMMGFCIAAYTHRMILDCIYLFLATIFLQSYNAFGSFSFFISILLLLKVFRILLMTLSHRRGDISSSCGVSLVVLFQSHASPISEFTILLCSM